MEPTLLAQQSSAIISRTREIFEDTPEGETPRQILCNAFYGVTDALLNITQVNGHPVVDISRQPTRSERWKSKAGLFALTTIDWLSQANHNLYGTNKPGLIGGSMTGIASVMGVPMLHKTDSFNNPLYALVVDIPQQEGIFPCVEAQNAASSLCGLGIDSGQITYCGEQRVQINHSDGEISVALLSPAGGLLAVPAETTCSVIGVASQDIATQVPVIITQTPLEPTVPVAPTSRGNTENVIPDYAATPGVPDVTCVENPLIGTYDVAAVIAGFQQACGINISPEMAQEFLNATGTEGRSDLYGSATAEQLAGWAEQQWPRFMGGVTPDLIAPTATNAPSEVAPITPSDICNLTDPGLEDRIVLNTGSPEELQADLLTKCGLDLTSEQFNFIAQALELDIWVNGTQAEVRLQFLKEMSLALGVGQKGPEVQVTPPPTPAILTGVEQVAPGGESVEVGEGFWDLNVIESYKNWVNGFPRETRVLVNMMNILLASLSLLGVSGLIRIIRKEQRKRR